MDGQNKIKNNNIPWVEKYRPKTLSDVVGNIETINRFRHFANAGNIPHMILSGPPGCGKTTTIHAMAHDMLGTDVKKAVLELNASDDRGIDVVRKRIKEFAEMKVHLPDGRHKIIVLDEVDSMTEGAQQALRRIMEKYSATTRFVLACNQSDRIIEPIQSRCAIVKYSRLSDEELKKRVLLVCEKEELITTTDGINAIVATSQGDMRQALNNLQCTASGYNEIKADNVYKVCDEPHPEEIQEFFHNCHVGDFRKSLDFLELQRLLGHAFTDILVTLGRTLIDADLPEVIKYEFSKIMGITHMQALQGHDGRLQMGSLAAQLSTVHRNLSSN